MNLNIEKFLVPQGKSVSLNEYDTTYMTDTKHGKSVKSKLKEDIKQMSKLQYRLYAENRQALLIVFQAMDAAGKDGAIKHVFSGINPQGCEVHNFKKPSKNELQHDYFWRHYVRLPDRGRIGIFNRSHYENVLVTRVHPEFLLSENLPGIHTVDDVGEDFWTSRFSQINSFEKNISENGITVIKFFLHLSKERQKKRFLERIDNSEKNWKFSSADIEERSFWNEYQKAYEEAISNTSTANAPWYIIPADKKWFSRVVVGSIIVETLKKMNIKMPVISKKEKAFLLKAKDILEKDQNGK